MALHTFRADVCHRVWVIGTNSPQARTSHAAQMSGTFPVCVVWDGQAPSCSAATSEVCAKSVHFGTGHVHVETSALRFFHVDRCVATYKIVKLISLRDAGCKLSM